MEVSGAICLRQPPTCSSLSGKANRRVEFRDNGHLQYYIRCGGDHKKKQSKSLKKNLKLIKKSLGKEDLSLLPLSLSDSDSALLHQAMLLQETAQGLMKQLQEVRAKEKELMMKIKPHFQSTTIMLDSSDSSSSQSSDCEPDEVIPIEDAPVALPPQPQLPAQPTRAFQDPTTSSPHLHKQSSVCYHDTTSSPNRIEVCMGSKCNKSGGAALLQEFQRVLGVEAAVVGCKCMGKCRDGPNVRAVNSNSNSNSLVTPLPPTHPLYIGVALEDVNAIVASFFSQDKKSLGLAPAPASASASY